jgi:hypothetical protein
MKSLNKIAIYALFFLLITGNIRAIAQDKTDTIKELNPKITLLYLSTSNDSVVLTANISVKREEGPFALENAVIAFTASDGSNSAALGESKTDYEGNAVLRVFVGSGLPHDKNGMTTYTASFAPKGKYTAATESAVARLARISVSFSKEDSVRNILVTASQVDAGGKIVPVMNEKVIVYVPRMLSLLKIGEIILDETGKGQCEYPGALVGDSLGNILIIAKIEENDTFGNVQGQSSITWGIPKQYYLAEKPTRELWTPIAPIWMIVTLIIMLTGVWAHYIYAVVQLVMIKRDSIREKNKPTF